MAEVGEIDLESSVEKFVEPRPDSEVTVGDIGTICAFETPGMTLMSPRGPFPRGCMSEFGARVEGALLVKTKTAAYYVAEGLMVKIPKVEDGGIRPVAEIEILTDLKMTIGNPAEAEFFSGDRENPTRGISEGDVVGVYKLVPKFYGAPQSEHSDQAARAWEGLDTILQDAKMAVGYEHVDRYTGAFGRSARSATVIGSSPS